MGDPVDLNSEKAMFRTPARDDNPAREGGAKDVAPPSFRSILIGKAEAVSREEVSEPPSFFRDLNLDQIVDTITAVKSEYNLKPIYYSLLNSTDEVLYRQEVFRDLENEALLDTVRSFAEKMAHMRRLLGLADTLYYKYNKEGCFLGAVELYCEAVTSLAHDLSDIDLGSRGCRGLRRYVMDYARSPYFVALHKETGRLREALSAVRYTVTIKGATIKVGKFHSEPDYRAEVEETFEKFRQGTVKDYLARPPAGSAMNHVEAQVLDLVAKLYPQTFQDLSGFCARHASYTDETIRIFDREIQFYLSYLEYTARLKHAGLKFCYPNVSDTSKEIHNYEGYDMALAHKFVAEHSAIVCNDFYLKDQERVLIVSGPNQGGKTTFARTFGQLHYLAALGCPVPGREARLFLFDRLFSHFGREEGMMTLRGHLEDDLARIHAILVEATSRSIVIMNEIFTSTTLEDAIFLSKKVAEKIVALDLICVWVTFVDELASFSEQTVSMVSTVFPDNPALRTFKIVRRPADGLAYATAIAEKYRLTYTYLKERITT